MQPNRHPAKHDQSQTQNILISRDAGSHQDSHVETYGELLPDNTCIELIRDSKTGSLQLLVLAGESQTFGPSIEVGGRVYVPAKLHQSLAQALILPVNCVEYGTTDMLFTSIEETFLNNGVPKAAALQATYSVLATWFPECLPAAPCIVITGPRPEASLLFSLLGCLVRHPMPLIDINLTSLRSHLMRLQPTLLINHELPRSAIRLLIAANTRHAQLPSKGGVVNIYSAKILYGGMAADDTLYGDGVFHINVSPSRGKLPAISLLTEEAVTSRFQPMLLMYRARNIAKVRNSDFDVPEFASGIRILARILGAPVVDEPKLQADIRPLLQCQQEKISAHRWIDKQCVVLESALAFCHREQVDRAYVGLIADTATKILNGRGESEQLTPKAVGHTLRSIFGISTKRDQRGCAVRLTEDNRRRIHRLARDFEVSSFEDHKVRCPHCTEVFAADSHDKPEEDLSDQRAE